MFLVSYIVIPNISLLILARCIASGVRTSPPPPDFGVSLRAALDLRNLLLTYPLLNEVFDSTHSQSDRYAVLKRSSPSRFGAGSCNCDSTQDLLDLGPGFHPQYLPTLQCSSSGQCPHSRMMCRGKTYPVKVLTARGPNELDQFLPRSLGAEWRFQVVNVTVDCECSFP